MTHNFHHYTHLPQDRTFLTYFICLIFLVPIFGVIWFLKKFYFIRTVRLGISTIDLDPQNNYCNRSFFFRSIDIFFIHF